jgi:hypothetical protein
MNKIIKSLFLAVLIVQSMAFADRIHYAVLENDPALIISILREEPTSLEAFFNNHYPTPLLSAASQGKTKALETLLDAGANIRARSTFQRNTALMLAAKGGHTDTVLALLDRGDDINARNMSNETALIFAKENKHPETIKAIARWLIENQIDVMGEEDEEILSEAYPPGLYELKFRTQGSKEERKKAVEKSTSIPQGPASIINEYIGD